MRVSLSILLILAFIIPAFGQDMKGAVGSGNNLKGAPFSAEAINESVQTLADGNRIVRRSVARLYRDSEGRFRREEMPTQLGVPGAVVDIPRTISINDPISGTRYTLYPKNQTYHESHFRSELEARQRAEQMKQQREAERQVREQERIKRQEERSKQQTGGFIDIGTKESAAAQKVEIKTEVKVEIAKVLKVATKTDMEDCDEPKNDPNKRVESLGNQNVEGVMAEGTRTTTIIPAGKIGNEQPIEVVYEKWYSAELRMIVYSKLTDPRVGVQTYRLTNINRTEQSINLFTPPPEYRPVSQVDPKPPALPKPPIPSIKPVTAKPAELKKT